MADLLGLVPGKYLLLVIFAARKKHESTLLNCAREITPEINSCWAPQINTNNSDVPAELWRIQSTGNLIYWWRIWGNIATNIHSDSFSRLYDFTTQLSFLTTWMNNIKSIKSHLSSRTWVSAPRVSIQTISLQKVFQTFLAWRLNFSSCLLLISIFPDWMASSFFPVKLCKMLTRKKKKKTSNNSLFTLFLEKSRTVKTDSLL